MRRAITVLAGGLIGAVLAGCRTPDATLQANSTRATPDRTAEIAALSNEVNRLSRKVESLEQDWAGMKPSMQFIQKLMDEMRYEPVVHEELLGVPTNETGTNAHRTSEGIRRPADGSPKPSR